MGSEKDAGAWRRTSFNVVEALRSCIADASAAVPPGAQVVGFKVAIAFQPAATEGELQACSSTITKALLNPLLIAKLFAVQAERAYQAAAETPHPDHVATILPGPGLVGRDRKPRHPRRR